MIASGDVQLLFLDIALALACARALGWVAEHVGQPRVVGEIVAGLALGQIAMSSVGGTLFPLGVRPLLHALADFGVVLFMLGAGFEVDRVTSSGHKRATVQVAIGAAVLPAAGGALLGFWLARRHDVVDPTALILFIAAATAVTAFPVLVRIVSDHGLQHTVAGGIAISSAALNDVFAWLLLAAAVSASTPTMSVGWRLVLFPTYVLVMAAVVRPLLRRLARTSSPTAVFLLCGTVLSAALTDWMGLHLIFGAFAFGLCLPRSAGRPGQSDRLAREVRQLGSLSSLLLPIYFVAAGLSVDLSALGASNWVEAAAAISVATVSKILGAYLGARFARMAVRDSFAVASLMNSRGLTELVVLSAGLQLGIIDDRLYSVMVIMAIATTAMTGPLVRLIYPEPRIRTAPGQSS